MALFEPQSSTIQFPGQNAFTVRDASCSPSSMIFNTASTNAAVEALNQLQPLVEAHPPTLTPLERSCFSEEAQHPLKRLRIDEGHVNSRNVPAGITIIRSSITNAMPDLCFVENDGPRPKKNLLSSQTFCHNKVRRMNEDEVDCSAMHCKETAVICSDQDTSPKMTKKIRSEAINHNHESKARFSDQSEAYPLDLERSDTRQSAKSINVKSVPINMSKPAIANGDHSMRSLQSTVKRTVFTDFLTAEQLRAHVSGLRDLKNLDAKKEKLDSSTLNDAGDKVCQLCAVGEKIFFAPAAIYCTSCGNRIKRRRNYYCSPQDCTEHYYFCSSCYREWHGNITIDGCRMCKADLVKRQNNDEREEPWVRCDRCEGWQHQVCALFNDKINADGKSEYRCPLCSLKDMEAGSDRMSSVSGGSTPWNAKDLPRSKLSDHIEQRLLRRLKEEREERAEVDTNEACGAEGLAVRVVLSMKKKLKVKSQFLNTFRKKKYPPEFPYRLKVIFLYQKIDGVDVCLFGMYVQEFGSECHPPNKRCVYISYLDSIKYFTPEARTLSGEALRTFVYHEVLLGYLDYCKKRGFSMCYIWSCPPLKGEDYILHCHPEMQRTPKADKLRQWYKMMLKKAERENIVVHCMNLYDRFFVSDGGEAGSRPSGSLLPYFEGGYWTSAAEDVLKSFQQESRKELQKKVRKLHAKRNSKGGGNKSSDGSDVKDVLLMQKLGQIILPMKDDFVIASLQHECVSCGEVLLSGRRWFCRGCRNFQLCSGCHDKDRGRVLKESGQHYCDDSYADTLSEASVDDIPTDTEDHDILLDNRQLEDRHTFLDFCEQNHYQFDTLRRAKHSSMMLLYHLHESIAANLAPLSATYVLKVVVHSSRCCSSGCGPCRDPTCIRIKRLFRHARRCGVRMSGGCIPCMRAWWLLITHSQSCVTVDCRVPRCMDLREWRRQKERRNQEDS